MENTDNIAIIYNPNAGQHRKKFLERAIKILESNAKKVTLYATEYPGHAIEIAANLKNNINYTILIAAGGDGTINEVINGIYGSDKKLGIIPLGTVSVLAREMGLKLTPEDVARTLMQEKTKYIYPALINGKCFSLMASIGIDASSVKNVNLKLKRKISKLAYVISFIIELFKSSFQSHNVTINADEYKSFCTIIAKGKLYAGEYICASEATIYDQYLHIVMLKKKGLVGLIKFFWAISRNNIKNLSYLEIVKTKTLSISSNHSEDVQIDGDYFRPLPITIKSSEKPISLIVPVS